MGKLKNFLSENGFSDIEFLQNNSFTYGDISICGTRGWTVPQLGKTEEDKKIYAREIIRAELSLKSAKNPENIIMFTHFPTVMQDFRENEMTELLRAREDTDYSAYVEEITLQMKKLEDICNN